MTKSKKIINNALSVLKAAVKNLEKGIAISETEKENAILQLAKEEARFITTKEMINLNISENDLDIKFANKIKSKITAIIE